MKKLLFNNNLKNKSFISIDQITTKEEIENIFRVADEMKELVMKKRVSRLLRGYCIAELFYQPSTRTFASFLAAARWLGAITIPIHGMGAYSSAIKGESIEDTVKSIYQTTASDLIIIRHPEDNSVERATKASYVPVINAGSGKREHPTQAILDLLTIKRELGRTENLRVIFLGDLKYGRTVKSLGRLLTIVDKNLELSLVSPLSLRLPKALAKQWSSMGAKIIQTERLNSVLHRADVLYVTRIQKEWFETEGKYRKAAGRYIIDKEILTKAKERMIVMHPLPRVNEIAEEVDDDMRSKYFIQMRYGLYTRMALLKLILVG